MKLFVLWYSTNTINLKNKKCIIVTVKTFEIVGFQLKNILKINVIWLKEEGTMVLLYY